MSQAAVWATVFLSVFTGPFAVKAFTGNFALGGLPFAMYSLASLLVVFPAGRLMDRVGRAPVLAFLGITCGAVPFLAGAALRRHRGVRALSPGPGCADDG